jgi:ribosomal protein S18 acetylase RimI-like enzyme
MHREAPRPVLLAPRDLAAIHALHAAAGPLPPGFLQPKTDAELLARLAGQGGAAHGIVLDGRLVAVALLRLPDAQHPNPPPGFPLVPPAEWPLLACGMEHALVHPDARGRGLQRALLAARLEHAARAGMHWAFAGVRLANQASWRNLLAAGFVIAGQRHDFGAPLIGLLRPVAAPLATGAADAGRVAPQDAEGHDAALGAGLVGVALDDAGDVIYRRLRHAGALAA